MAQRDRTSLRSNEIVLHEIKRHPIGVYSITVVAGMLLAVLFVALFYLVRNDIVIGLSDTVMAVVFMVLVFVVLAISYISFQLYVRNQLIITNESLIQILQQGIFDSKVSRLNLAKVQDVTVDQQGVLSSVLNYGTIVIETAGEASNYNFPYSPQPVINAGHIIEAQEQYMRSYHRTNAFDSLSQ